MSVSIQVSEKRLSDVPINRLIFGNFIESGLARQVPCMWAEMLFNRSFRDVAPINMPVWEWIGFDEGHFDSSLPFWHSGYEECDWELFGTASTRRTLGTDTFKGDGSLIVSVPTGGFGGVRQEGIYLHAGETYDLALFGRFRGNRNSDTRRPVRVSLRWEGGETPFVTEELAVGYGGEEYRLSLEALRDGRAVLEIGFAGEGELVLAWASMMPRETVHGWRRDVVDLLKRVAPPIIRFPGGCFASFSDWRDSVGPRSERQATTSYYWGGPEENDVGIDEFLDLCDAIGCEPQYCINMMTSTPFKAAELVEYCNGPDDSAMGCFRTLNGVRRARRVQYWEMDNETGRKWSALEYAHKVVEFAAEMRRVDPDIKIMMEAYCWGLEWLPKMLEIAGRAVNYVIQRDGTPDFVRQVLPILREYSRTHGTDVRLVNTEWLPDPSSPGPLDDPRIPPEFEWAGEVANDPGRSISMREGTWYYALNAADRLLDYLSYGGEFHLANFNNCANTWGQNVIEASKEGVWLSPCGRVFELFMKDFRGEFPLETAVEGVGLLSAQGCLDAGGGSLSVYVVNRDVIASELLLELPDGYRVRSGESLAAPNRMSRAMPDGDPVERTSLDLAGRTLRLKPLSVTVVRAAL